MNTSKARKLLDIESNASTGEIEDAYREKAKQHHPDLSDDPNAEEKFIEIKEAKQHLIRHHSQSSSKSTTSKENGSAKTNTSTRSSKSRSQSRSSSRSRSSSEANTNRSKSYSASSDNSWRENRKTRDNTTSSSQSQTKSESTRTTNKKKSSSNRNTTNKNWTSSNDEQEKGTDTDSSNSNGGSKTSTSSSDSSATKTSIKDKLNPLYWIASVISLFPTPSAQTEYDGSNIPYESKLEQFPHKYVILYYLHLRNALNPRYSSQIRNTKATPIITTVLIAASELKHKIKRIVEVSTKPENAPAILVGGGITTIPVNAAVPIGWKITAVLAFIGAAFVTIFVLQFDREIHSSDVIKEANKTVWNPVGELVILGIFAIAYHMIKLGGEKYIVQSSTWIVATAVFSIPTIAVTHYLSERGKDKYKSTTTVKEKKQFSNCCVEVEKEKEKTETVWKYPPSIPTVVFGIIATTIIIHIQPYPELMPGNIIGSGNYGPNPLMDGLVSTFVSSLWILMIIPAVSFIEIGWNKSSHNLTSVKQKAIPTSIVNGTLSVLLWVLLPITPSPPYILGVFETTMLFIGVFIYSYSIIVTPKS
jgi:curved DNA-binding protein CbpA